MPRAVKIYGGGRSAGKMDRATMLNEAERRDDPFVIPDFLKIPQAKRDAAWDRNPPRATPFIAPPPRNYEPLPELVAARKARSLNKLQAWKREGQATRDLRGMVWDTMKSRWVPDRFAHMRCVPGKGVKDTAFKPTKELDERGDGAGKRGPDAEGANLRRPPSPSLSSSDDLGARVSAHCGADNAKLKRFAKANGVWHDKYDALPNNGLRRMNVVNRLRGRLKREPEFKVKWLS